MSTAPSRSGGPARAAWALFLALACAAPTGARADWPPEGTLVSTLGTAHGNDQVQLFRDPASSLLIVWRFLGGTGQAGHVQRMTEHGEIAGGWPADGVFPNAYSDFPAVPDGAGGVYDVFAINSGSNLDVFLERTNADATHAPSSGWGWPIATTSAQEFAPSIAGDGAGGAYVAWIRDYHQVYLQRLTSAGVPAAGWPAAGLLIGAPPASVSGPLAMAADGAGVVVMWLGDYPRAQRVTGAGAVAAGWPVGGIQLGTGAPDFFSPTTWLLPSSADHWIAAWAERPSGGDGRITLQRFGADGSLDDQWPSDGLVAVSPGTPIGSALTRADGAGGVTLLWEQSSLPRVLRVLPDASLAPGYAAGGESPLDAGALYAGGLAAATGHDGGVIVGWFDARPSGAGVRVRWLLGDGTPDPAEPAAARLATPSGSVAVLRGLLEDGAGGVYVAWQDEPLPEWSRLRLRRMIPSALVGVDRAPLPNVGIAIHAIAPNPAGRSLEVRYALAGEWPAHLELLDLSGRRVRALRADGAGVARFPGLDQLPPGVYIVRLVQGGASRAARVAILH